MRTSHLALAALSAVMMLIGSTGLAGADGKVDPAGTWKLKVSRPGRPTTEPTLKLEKTGDKWAGLITDAQGRSVPIKDAEFKNGELSFRTVIEREGQQIVFIYKGKVTADTIKGQASVSFLGQNRTFPFEAARFKEEVTLAGLWKVTLVLESGQKLQPTIRFKQEGDKLTGTFLGNAGKEIPLQDVSLKDGEFSFQVIDEIEDDKVPFQYSGKLKGDAVNGTVKLGGGNQVVSLKFQADRIKTPTANVSGTWKLKVPLKDGPTFEPTIKLVQNGITLSGTYIGEQGETPIGDALIFGDEVTFEVARERDGKKYKLRYQAKVNGDTLTGNVDYYFDGIGGWADFQGQRVGRTESSAK